MWKISLCFVVCLLMSMCQTENDIACKWQPKMDVVLINNFLALPCENDCLGDADYSSLDIVFSSISDVSLYNIVNAPNLGLWKKSSFTWFVTAGTNRCSSTSQQAVWSCNQDSNLLINRGGCSGYFNEGPYLITYEPNSAKYQFELIVETNMGKRLIWTKVISNKSVIKNEGLFIVTDYEHPVRPQVVDMYRAPSKIYIHNHFVE